jgi:hypothetical protein
MEEIGLLKLVVITAGRPLSMRVENLRSLISASVCGVTSPLNKASTASGTDGNAVLVTVGEVAGVAVIMKLVALLSGVSNGEGGCVNSGVGNGVRVLRKGMDGRLNLGSWVKIMSRTPTATKAPKIEKAFCARTVFCWRVM